MQKPEFPINEKERLAALESYNILDSLPEKSFDDLSLIASLICNTPIALISLIDKDRQWFKSKHGLNANETHRDISFCGHAINNPLQIFEIKDAKNDERFSDNPLVKGELNIGFYAGVPLIDDDNYALGTLCVIDHKPKALTEEQKIGLSALAREVMNYIKLGKKSKDLKTTVELKEKALKESQKKYRKLYNDAPDMMASIDAKTKKIIDCNSTLCINLGYTRKELQSGNLMMLYHEDCHKEVLIAFKTFIKKGEVNNHRLIIKKKNGEKINVGLSVKAVKNKYGIITHSNSIWRNIDKIILAERLLMESNSKLESEVKERTKEIESHRERLELALAGSNDGIWDWIDFKSKTQWWSPRYYELLGYKEGEIEPNIDIFSKKLLHHDDEERLWKSFTKCSEEGVPMNDEYRLKTKNEGYKWFRGKANVIKDKTGKAVRIAGSISDIHKQKLLELKLKETERFLTKVTDIAPSIIYVFNHVTMSNEYANKEIGSVLGYSEKEIQAMGDQLIPSLCHPEDLELLYSHFSNILTLKDQETIKAEYRMKNKSSKYIWLLSEDTVFERNEKNEVIKHIGIATEISQLKNTAEQLKNQTNLLAEQNRDLKQFAYVATHDLKNPILTLKGHFEYLRNEFNGKKLGVIESFEFVDEEITNFENTLKGLTEAIKIREKNIELIPISINQQIKNCVSLFEFRVHEIGGEIKLHLDKRCLILGTELYITSVIQNIISNSIKYYDKSRKLKIEIISKIENNNLHLTFSDNGLGIDLKLHKERLFKMFNRFHNQAEGNGMGLYMVKHMVEKLDGKIELRSKVNKGTKIDLILKLVK
jgi:PAS domain S-box-containing protein